MITEARTTIALILVLMLSSVALATGSFSLPTGVIKYDKNKSYKGMDPIFHGNDDFLHQ
jgi:hypothetical protein